MNGQNPKHTWNFFRAGGFDQVKLESGADLANLDQLDQKLWVALACPTRGLELDSQTLALIDSDKDGRIRAPELIAAAQWAVGMLKNPDDLLQRSPSLPLNAVNDTTPDGKGVLQTAKQILADAGKKDATAISVDDIANTEKFLAATNFNGDGIVPADAAGDDVTQGVITDIIACMGPEADSSGKPGVNQAKVDAFFAEAEEYSNWWKQIETDKTVMPLGAGTAAASVAVKAVAAKMNDFFTRCRLAAFDARALPALNRQAWDYAALAQKDLSANAAEFSSFPLAEVAPGKPLPLLTGVNPAWAGAIAELHASAVKPLLGNKDSLTEADWNSLQSTLEPFEKHSACNVGPDVQKLGLVRIRQILAGKFKSDITALIVKDLTTTSQANIVRLVRYYHDLYTLCLNYVNFKCFYSRKEPAVFQAGRLYLDQRSCDLCLTVEDAARHASMAGLAGAFLAYVECTRKATNEKLSILAVFSQGDDDNLMVGRNGIFYDRKGRDFDATITSIIPNPISIHQAIWAPYKKLMRFIEEKVAQHAANADAAAVANLQSTASSTTATTTPATPTKIDTGTLAAIGLVLTTLMGALGVIFTKLFGLPSWEIPLAILGILVAISLPSVVMAWLKLRKRNLGPILDANGWALNTRARINVPFGASLTKIAALPPGSQRDLRDPFAEKKKPWELYLTLLIIIALGALWYFGKLDKFVPNKIKTTTVFGTNAFDYVAPPSPPAPAPTNTVPHVVSTNAPAK
ncbi:MAG TPA: hypothetical protein VGN23_02910 [Verrucomicrobiae bacterium]|jgi:hypothetical protein